MRESTRPGTWTKSFWARTTTGLWETIGPWTRNPIPCNRLNCRISSEKLFFRLDYCRSFPAGGLNSVAVCGRRWSWLRSTGFSLECLAEELLAFALHFLEQHLLFGRKISCLA